MAKPVSVIVPVYRTEPYLRRCVDSLLAQTLTDIEIIVVNDGSPDNSQRIIDEYQEKHKGKVKGYSKANGGLGSARNFGIEAAAGEYIGFVDSDDYVRPDMFEKMYRKATELEADLVICDFSFVDEDGNLTATTGIVHHADLPLESKTFAHKYGRTEACNKLYRRDLFLRTGIRYPKGRFEDYPTTALMIEAAKKVAYVDEPLMYYVRRRGSIMDSALREFSAANFDIFERSRSILEHKDSFSNDSFNLFQDEIIPTHTFLKFFLPILAISDANERRAIITRWGRELNDILPDWDQSKAVVAAFARSRSIFTRAFLRTVVRAFKSGDAFWLSSLLAVLGPKVIQKRMRKAYGL